MPLIRIEVSDFKSYRGHQTIGPFRNFTSVIGPNGAGKSNLMDAISFVLGVKSAQLRSSQLKDLVYRGRRLAREDDPERGSEAQDEEEEDDNADQGEGTAKKAWVLAVYEDEHKKEWRFQRTISTTGASEYKLNGKVVTYSAYNATLISHNILVKAKNFLVFQGDVEAVASQSPKDLSRLIEQISGSLELAAEYEKAKDEQDKATENATLNFTKRRGIAGEIKQYKEQKSEAERFEALCQERDDLVLHRILFKLFHIEEAIEKNTIDIGIKSRTLVGLREELEEKDEALAAARAAQAQARSVVQQKERQIKRAEKARNDKDPDIAAIDAQIKHSSRKQANAEKAQTEVTKSAEAQQQKIDGLKKELANVQKAADAAQEAQRQASQANLSLSKESLEEYRRLKALASTRAVGEKQALEALTRDEKTTRRLLEQLKEKQEGLDEKKNRLTTDLQSNTDHKKELEQKISDHSSELRKVRQDKENQVSQRRNIATLEKEANEKLAEIQNKLLQANLENNQSEKEIKIKELIGNLQRLFPGVRGQIADLCKPTQRKYDTAVSVVLGRNREAIVVDEEKTAIDCIDYMRNQRAGQATFIPLDTIQVKPINDKFRSFAKGARLAVDVVQHEPAVERAIHHACGNALVCDTMDVARYVAYERGQEVKAVTLEGTIIHKSGLITGGRSTHSSSKKSWTDEEYKGWEKQRDKLMGQLRDLAKQRPRESDDKLDAEIARLDSVLMVARDDLSGVTLKLDGIKRELKHVNQELANNAPQLQKAQRTWDEIYGKVKALKSKIEEEEQDIFASFCEEIGVSHIGDFEDRQLKLAQQESEARLRFENQIARLRHQHDFEMEQLKLSQERLQNYERALTAESETLERLEAQLREAKDEAKTMDEELEALQQALKVAKADLEARTKELDAVKKDSSASQKGYDRAVKEIANMNDEIEKLAVERSAIYRKCRVEEIQLPLLQGSLRNVPMEENFTEEVAMAVDEDESSPHRPRNVPDHGIEVDFESIEDDERQDGSPAKLADLDASISKIIGDIESMAPNMKAMERLDDVEAKLAQTELETDKARKESKQARDHFTEIKRKRCEMFNKAYNHISERIDTVYKDLTKGKSAPMGGVAYLSLEDNEEPYAAGIKYHAMPPMKRFRDMEQLSGGEKTVAALALLFAIHSYQPAPFFVLDEVDAALDNTNVAKIANYIKSQASEAFQFIVISLKGSLYERGDSLVGIFRDQEVNSSRTLTLALTQYDE